MHSTHRADEFIYAQGIMASVKSRITLGILAKIMGARYMRHVMFQILSTKEAVAELAISRSICENKC